MTLQHRIDTAPSACAGSTSTVAAPKRSSRSGAPLPSASAGKGAGEGEQGGAAVALLDSPLPDGRFLFHFEGSSRHVGMLIEDLRRRGYRRVAGPPQRVHQYAVERLAGGGRNYRLEWIEPKPARQAKA